MTATLASRPPRPTTLEIDLDAAAANVRAVRRLVVVTRPAPLSSAAARLLAERLRERAA